MDMSRPPLRSDYPAGRPGDALWGQDRAIWFKENRKPRRAPEPEVIEREVVRTEYVEVERIVEVASPAPDPVELLRIVTEQKRNAFIEGERKPWETVEEAGNRLLLEHESLMNRQRNPFTQATREELDRYKELTAGLGLSLAG